LGYVYDEKDIAIGLSSSAGTSSGTSAFNTRSIAIGQSAAANNEYTTALGYMATATGIRGTAIGYDTQATGQTSVAIGASAQANAEGTVALGSFVKIKIPWTVTLYGYGGSADRSTTLLLKNPEKIFFANEDATSTTNNYTQLSQFTSGKTLQSYLDSVPYLTTAPTADNTDSRLKIVVLSSEPVTRYNGYLYIITEE